RHPTAAHCAKTRIRRPPPVARGVPVLRRMPVPFSWTPCPPPGSVFGEFPGNGVRLYPNRTGLHGLAPLIGGPSPQRIEDDDLAHRARSLQLVHRRSGTNEIAGLAGLLRAGRVDVDPDLVSRRHRTVVRLVVRDRLEQ